MVFKSKREMVKDIEASFEEEVTEVEAEEETTEGEKKPSGFKNILIFIALLLSLSAGVFSYYLNEQLHDIQKREEDRAKREISVINPLSHNVKVSQREVGRHAVLLAEHEEAKNSLMQQNKQIALSVGKNTKALLTYNQEIQKNSHGLGKVVQLIEETNGQQEKVNIELKSQMEQWLQAEVDKIMVNLANKERQLQLLTKQANDLDKANKKSNKQSKVAVTDNSVNVNNPSSKKQAIAMSTPQATQVKEKVVVTKVVQKTIIKPDLSLLKLHEIRSLVQIMQDSLSFSYQKRALTNTLDKAYIRLQKVNNTHQVSRLVEQAKRLASQQSDSVSKQHIETLSAMIGSLQSLTVVNEKVSLQNIKNNNSISGSPVSEQSKESIESTAADKSNLELASDKFVNELKSLITFRHTKKKANYLIAPADAFVLKQNLGLKLEVARLALMDKDEPLYQRLLNESLDILNRYFDLNTKNVSMAMETLSSLLKQPLNFQRADMNVALQKIIQAIDVAIQQHSQAQTATMNRKHDLFSGVNN